MKKDPPPDFEVANDPGRVRCTVCHANNCYEPWIRRSSAAAHTRGKRHIRAVAEKRRQADMVARNNKLWRDRASETEKMFGESFVPMDAVPSVRVTRNEPAVVPSQLLADEEEEMTRRVLRYLDDPQKDDPISRSIDSWKTADRSLEDQVVAGCLRALGPDTGDEETVRGTVTTREEEKDLSLLLPQEVVDAVLELPETNILPQARKQRFDGDHPRIVSERAAGSSSSVRPREDTHGREKSSEIIRFSPHTAPPESIDGSLEIREEIDTVLANGEKEQARGKEEGRK